MRGDAEAVLLEITVNEKLAEDEGEPELVAVV